MSEGQAEKGPDPAQSGESSESRRPGQDCDMDMTYLRSLEGLMKLISLPIAVIGLILTAIGLIAFGGWYIFVGVGYIIYVVVVIVIEVFLPNWHIHKLIDGVVMGIYAFLWGLTAIANLAVAVSFGNVLVGIGMIFSVACCGLCIAGTIFAIQAYRRNLQDGTAPSHTIMIF